jgi:cytidylate kinase
MIQRQIAKGNDCVLEGRDIGTVVFPNAEFKFFLIADLEIRAKRRLIELVEMGELKSVSELIDDIKRRDEFDSSRDHSPLKKAEDAIPIDTSHITIDEQINKIVNLINHNK